MDVYNQVRTAYDQIVLEYAKRNHFKISANLVTLAQGLVEHVGQNCYILEVGCGTGRDMAWFESQGSIITGIDLSMGMLKYARQQVHSQLLSMNMRNLGFCNSCFDGAWCCASLLHLPKIEAALALQETRRILKFGGMLVLSIQEGNGEEWEESYVSGVKRFFARYQVDEMKDILSRSGFSVAKTDSSYDAPRAWLSFVCIAN